MITTLPSRLPQEQGKITIRERFKQQMFNTGILQNRQNQGALSTIVTTSQPEIHSNFDRIEQTSSDGTDFTTSRIPSCDELEPTTILDFTIIRIKRKWKGDQRLVEKA
ncbi:hypothetical protein AVEN_40666-1 [Araneus ventricosus]|uniref:Uncharacterized protein n=1 Tax=Araneus ventricosus TaxID=182803 RepID=A0A4Y2VJV4_ARAVE|nr:hypothetical protein AVEN_40666-1 [Araneus ventricosus]